MRNLALRSKVCLVMYRLPRDTKRGLHSATTNRHSQPLDAFLCFDVSSGVISLSGLYPYITE